MVLICGPTGIGKSKLGIEIAKIFGTDIISADSMQVYKGMDIGTDKIDSVAYGVKQHMIDLCHPDHKMTVKEFKDMTEEMLVEEFRKEKKVPIVVGGSGMYIKAIINELKSRAVGNNSVKEAETVKGLTNKLGGFGGGFLVGGLSGVAVTAYHYRGKIQDMESRLSAMETSMKETESELRKESEERKRQQKANEAVRKFDNGLRMDNAFLSEYNRKNRTTDFLG